MTEAQEIRRERLRQNSEVALHVAGRETGGWPAVRARPDRQAC
jgi:hypothetical protein